MRYLIIIILILFNLSGFTQSLQDNRKYKLDSIFLKNNILEIAESVYDNGWVDFKYELNLNPETVFTEYKQLFGLGHNDEMVLFKVIEDKSGNKHYRYKQTYKGVEIEGMQYILHSKDGKVINGNGKILSGLTTQVNPSVSNTYALSRIVNQLSLSDNIKREANNHKNKLVLFKVDEEKDILDPEAYKLCFKFEALEINDLDFRDIYVNASTSKVEKNISRNRHANGSPGTGTAETLYNGIQQFTVYRWIPVWPNSPTWHIGFPIKDLGAEGDFGKILCYRGNINTSPPGKITSDDGVDWHPFFIPFVSAYWAAEQSLEYYETVWENSYYEEGVGNTKLHVLPNRKPDTLAFFVPGQDNDYIFLGKDDPNNNRNHVVSLDIIAHEFTHGIIYRATGGTAYQNETGSLEESFCDIMAAVIDNWVEGYDHDRIYTLGEDPFPTGSFSIRSISDPKSGGSHGDATCATLPGQPDTYGGEYWYNGGCTSVHSNGGVQNYWFYLLAEGGTHNGVTVSGIGINEAAKIVYKNMTEYFLPGSDYKDARNGAIKAAALEFGICSNEYLQTINAWNAVMVTSSSNYGDNLNLSCEGLAYFHSLGVPITSTASNLLELSCSLSENSTTILRSGNEIILKPGFNTATGSEAFFHAYIIPCEVNSNSRTISNAVTKNKINKNEDNHLIIEEDGNIKVYPNPNNGEFELYLPLLNNSELNKVKIYDIYGNILLERNITQTLTGLDISSYSSGIYLIKIYSNDRIIVKRVIKE